MTTDTDKGERMTLTHTTRCHCGRYAKKHVQSGDGCGNVCGVHGRKGVLHDRAIRICAECNEHITEGKQVERLALGSYHGKYGAFHRGCYERTCSWCGGAGYLRDGATCPECGGSGYASE